MDRCERAAWKNAQFHSVNVTGTIAEGTTQMKATEDGMDPWSASFSLVSVAVKKVSGFHGVGSRVWTAVWKPAKTSDAQTSLIPRGTK